MKNIANTKLVTLASLFISVYLATQYTFAAGCNTHRSSYYSTAPTPLYSCTDLKSNQQVSIMVSNSGRNCPGNVPSETYQFKYKYAATNSEILVSLNYYKTSALTNTNGSGYSPKNNQIPLPGLETYTNPNSYVKFNIIGQSILHGSKFHTFDSVNIKFSNNTEIQLNNCNDISIP